MSKVGAALVLAALLLLPGCGIAGEKESAPPQIVKPADLVRMERKEQLGPLARGLRFDPKSSGPESNSQAANESTDPKDTGRTLAKKGRVRGYNLTYSSYSRPTELGVIELSEGVELFRTEKAASRYLKKGFAEYQRHRGRTVDGVKVTSLEEFDVDTGNENGGLRVTLRYPSHRVTLHMTVVAFRRGRVVANALALLRRDLVVSGDVERIADALDQQITRVGSGVRAPVALTQKLRKRIDPKPFAFEPKDLPLETKPSHEGYVTAGGTRIYLREYDVLGGRLGGSKPFYVRYTSAAYPTARAAARDERYVASRKGSNSVARHFLRLAFKNSDFKLRGFSAGPIRFPGGASGFRFFTRVPKGRLEGVEIKVVRGRVASSVLIMGFDRNIEPSDLRPLGNKLRARLRAAA